MHEILIVPLRQQSMEPFCWVKHLWAQHLHDTKDPAWLRMGIQDEKAKGCRAVRLTHCSALLLPAGMSSLTWQWPWARRMGLWTRGRRSRMKQALTRGESVCAEVEPILPVTYSQCRSDTSLAARGQTYGYPFCPGLICTEGGTWMNGQQPAHCQRSPWKSSKVKPMRWPVWGPPPFVALCLLSLLQLLLLLDGAALPQAMEGEL